MSLKWISYFQDNFEAKYNFRFQEEGGGEIKSYARNVMDYIHRHAPGFNFKFQPQP